MSIIIVYHTPSSLYFFLPLLPLYITKLLPTTALLLLLYSFFFRTIATTDTPCLPRMYIIMLIKAKCIQFFFEYSTYIVAPEIDIACFSYHKYTTKKVLHLVKILKNT